jgi:outer membrane lipoprotein-sorting protein
MLFLVPLCCPAVVGAGEPKTADDVIAKYIEAIGGREKLDSVKTIRMTGKMIGMGGMEIPNTIETKRPNKVRFEFTFQGMTGVRAFDGETGWSIMPFMGKTEPEKMPPDQIKQIDDQADMDGPLVDYKKKGHEVELVGKEDIEGTEAYKLKVTKKGGEVEYHFLDAEYFLPIQTKGKYKMQGTELEYTVVPGDYKEVGGLLYAHSMEQRMGAMGGTTMTVDKIELNVKLDDNRFTMPEVKKEETPEADTEKDAAEKKETKPAEDKG